MSEILVVSSTTPKVYGETNYLTGLIFGIIAALIVIAIIYIGRMWYRRRRTNDASIVSDLPQQQREEPPPVIISSSWSSGEDIVYYPPVPTQNLSKSKQSTEASSSHPIYKAESSAPSKPLSTVLPKLQETHFCPHSRESVPRQQQEQQQHNYRTALHCAPTRPKALTPPPSNASTSTYSTQKTYDSARSITPRRPHRFGTKKISPIVAPPSEQRSEDVNEQSSTANMMAMNKMSKDDAKRMKQTSRNRPLRKQIRRPQPVSAEAITAAVFNSNEAQVIPVEDFKDPRLNLYSQEHVVDFPKPEPMLKSDATQNDEIVEMPTTKKKQTV